MGGKLTSTSQAAASTCPSHLSIPVFRSENSGTFYMNVPSVNKPSTECEYISGLVVNALGFSFIYIFLANLEPSENL